MKFLSLTGLLATAALPAALAFPSLLSGRALSATDQTLYAYGTNISGLPILYSLTDGLLYVAQSNTTATGIVSVSWDIPAITSASTTESTAYLANGTSPGVLYATVDQTSLTNVGVVKSGSESNTTTTGYTLYGQQLIYYDGTSLEAKFWAKMVVAGADSVWQLFWNNENELETKMTPVTIKTIAPATASTSD